MMTTRLLLNKNEKQKYILVLLLFCVFFRKWLVLAMRNIRKSVDGLFQGCKQ
jgi:hypothetical protein